MLFACLLLAYFPKPRSRLGELSFSLLPNFPYTNILTDSVNLTGARLAGGVGSVNNKFVLFFTSCRSSRAGLLERLFLAILRMFQGILSILGAMAKTAGKATFGHLWHVFGRIFIA